MTKKATSAVPAARFFRTPADWRRWLEKHHATAREIHVGLYKRHASHKGIGYEQALEEALCWGWIDGVTRTIDDERWVIRFTPRRKGSYWSARNVARAERLMAEGRMASPGLAAFEARSNGDGYSFEQRSAALTRAEERLIEANAAARAFWEASPPSYRKVATHWVTSAKWPETRARRLRTLIEDAAKGLRIRLVRRPERAGDTTTGSDTRKKR